MIFNLNKENKESTQKEAQTSTQNTAATAADQRASLRQRSATSATEAVAQVQPATPTAQATQQQTTLPAQKPAVQPSPTQSTQNQSENSNQDPTKVNQSKSEYTEIEDKDVAEKLLGKKDEEENISDADKLDPKKAQKQISEMRKQVKNFVKEGQDIQEEGIGEIINLIIKEAYDNKASDVHIEPRLDMVLVRLRIDGILVDYGMVEKEYEEPLIFKIKVNAKLRTDVHFTPQDGRIKFPLNENDTVDTRISILPTSHGEKIVIRLLTQHGRYFTLKDLGLNQRGLDIMKKNYLKPHGTIISSGPTGSGKTTTLYSILQIINSRKKNITTVEDPVEYDISGVNHVQVNPKAGLTFEKGLRSILRQDPDIIMIGEIRDTETAEIAINASMTGHLVLSTIHTNDSVTTIPRLIDMGVEPFLVANALNVVLAQRLARKLCENCKKAYKVDNKMLEELGKIRPDIQGLLKVGEEIYQEQGCDQCNSTGFKGRVGLFEIFEVTEEIRKIIITSGDIDEIKALARQQGLVLILEDGISKARGGILSISELLRVTALKQ